MYGKLHFLYFIFRNVQYLEVRLIPWFLKYQRQTYKLWMLTTWHDCLKMNWYDKLYFHQIVSFRSGLLMVPLHQTYPLYWKKIIYFLDQKRTVRIKRLYRVVNGTHVYFSRRTMWIFTVTRITLRTYVIT